MKEKSLGGFGRFCARAGEGAGGGGRRAKPNGREEEEKEQVSIETQFFSFSTKKRSYYSPAIMSSLAPVILYSFVARGTTVLCEKSGNFTGNFSQVRERRMGGEMTEQWSNGVFFLSFCALSCGGVDQKRKNFASSHLPFPRSSARSLLLLQQVAMQCLDKVAARPGASGATGGGGAGGASLIPAVVGAPSTSSSGYAPSSPSSSSSSSSSSQRVTYTCDRHLFNFLSEPGPSGLTFCAVSPESAGRALPFAFLERVAEDFHSRHENASSLASLPAHALDRAFSPRLALAADYVAEHPEAASKVASVQRQVDAVRDVMVENIERVLERGERIELLVDKTDGLRDQAARFQASGREAEDVVERESSFFCFGGREGVGERTR